MTGALPGSTTAFSPAVTLTPPNWLVASTTPSSIVIVVPPSAPTSTTNSVPLIAAVTVGVSTRPKSLGLRLEK